MQEQVWFGTVFPPFYMRAPRVANIFKIKIGSWVDAIAEFFADIAGFSLLNFSGTAHD